MSAKSKFIFDETKLKPGQREAAALLVEAEFTPRESRKHKEEIAEEVGITRMTLYRWENNDANFIAYKNYLASDVMDSHLPLVYARLIGIINQGNAKGIELFLKRIGDLDTKSEVTVRDGGQELSYEDRRKELLARLGADLPEGAITDLAKSKDGE